MKTKKSFNRQRMYITAQKFVKAKSFSGLILFTAAITAMIIANSPLAHYYFSLLKANFFIGFSSFTFSMDVKHLVNDGLMTLFFLLAGLEIKREISVGQLSSFKSASFPVFGAIGGMLIPAGIYILFNYNGQIQGFGVPMATDIAFALGILLLLGNRIPIALKLFLVTLAVADDLGAVVVIALFYTESLNWMGISLSLITLVIMMILNRKGVKALLPYMILGLFLWHWFHISGIHASVSGILLAFIIPLTPAIDTSAFLKRLKLRLNYFESLEQTRTEKLLTHKQIGALDIMGHTYSSVQAPLVRLEHNLIPISAFLVMPVFAFFNAGVTLSSVSLSLFHPVSLGIILGLTIGKPLGIFGTVYLMDYLGFSKKPNSLRWVDIFGASLLAGVGFTMSIFVGDIAFSSLELINLAKLSIIISSIISGLLGAIWLIKTISIKN
ncbi:MAG: Na+/H+ antiporter NhaA type [uncultured Sulfurovum sp.]|uniref:Na(+)/H(+) antiporter NhaA n=1 Tax=uncultured Sulfurovum sp. TaxID=269237 RepID=A0A6S6THW5_9BACT|nr:MAG: Na+/H+ antiporter NhaA type [uncultured Sulfurovum sp.]